MARTVLCALAASLLATAVSATTTTINGSFTARDWTGYIGDPVSAPAPISLSYSVTFNPTQSYTDAEEPLVVAGGFPFALGFSFNPVTSRMVLATHGSPDGCSHPEASFCAIIDDFLANEPFLVVLAPGSDGAWRAGAVDPGDGLVDPVGVPEPASWAMLIAGFGLVGAAQRQSGRRRADLAA
jgi:hypothetical protein